MNKRLTDALMVIQDELRKTKEIDELVIRKEDGFNFCYLKEDTLRGDYASYDMSEIIMEHQKEQKQTTLDL